VAVLDGLEVFVAICEAGSIAGAGRALGTPRATLSRQLKRLEEELGVRLLHRSTRRLVPTRAGEELFNRVRHVVQDAAEAREAVRRLDGVPRGTLRVSVPPDINEPLSQVLLSFLDAFPEVRIEVVGSAEHVDLVAQRFDVAIRGGDVVNPDLVVRRLLRTRLRVYGSASYLEQHGRPLTAQDLQEHACIVGLAQGREPLHAWPLLDGGTVGVSGRLVVNSLVLQVAAVRRGHGLALLPHVGNLVPHADLVPVLEDVVGHTSEVSVVFPERALMLPRVRAFVDHVARELPRLALQEPPPYLAG